MEVTHSNFIFFCLVQQNKTCYFFSLYSFKNGFHYQARFWFFVILRFFLYFLFCHKNDDKGTHIFNDFIFNQIEYIRLLFAQHQHYWWISSGTNIMLHLRRALQIYSIERQTQKKHAHISVFILMSCPKMRVLFFAAHCDYHFNFFYNSLNIEIFVVLFFTRQSKSKHFLWYLAFNT